MLFHLPPVAFVRCLTLLTTCLLKPLHSLGFCVQPFWFSPHLRVILFAFLNFASSVHPLILVINSIPCCALSPLHILSRKSQIHNIPLHQCMASSRYYLLPELQTPIAVPSDSSTCTSHTPSCNLTLLIISHYLSLPLLSPGWWYHHLLGHSL